ncbi:MAG: SDR family oxidoreductase [Sphingobacterium sp.]
MDKQNTLIIGANGKIGRLVSAKMAKSVNFQAVAGIRGEEQIPYFAELGLTHRLIDLEGSVEKLASNLQDIQAIVFTAGSGETTKFDRTLTVDLDGAVKCIEAAEAAGVNRFVMVSAIHADNRGTWEATGIKPYYIAKHYADRALKNSSLDYTILRPARLLDGQGTGQISVDSESGAPLEIFREDVAEVVLHVLAERRFAGKTIDLINGERTIADELASF